MCQHTLGKGTLKVAPAPEWRETGKGEGGDVPHYTCYTVTLAWDSDSSCSCSSDSRYI